MWSYYGSKSRVVHLYPPPKHGRIIEPFAGSARYSLRYFERDVLLVDAYDVVIRIWKYLQQCSPKDIMGLPKLPAGADLRKLNLSEDERMFLGMLAGIASTAPRFTVSKFSGEHNGRKNRMKRIADQLHKIKHWQFLHGSYEEIPNQEATWFIDSPYQNGGHAYIKNKIDFNHLAIWSKEREGQVIVCENSKADWLPFNPLSKMRGANMKHTTESIWLNYKSDFDNQQTKLFT